MKEQRTASQLHPDDAIILQRFERQAIPRSEWTHAMHLRVGWLTLERWGVDVAVDRMRHGVRALNDANGVANTPDAGYHETMTIAWLRLIDAARRQSRDATSAAFVSAHPELCRSDALLRHFSKALLASREARQAWVEPDLHALP